MWTIFYLYRNKIFVSNYIFAVISRIYISNLSIMVYIYLSMPSYRNKICDSNLAELKKRICLSADHKIHYQPKRKCRNWQLMLLNNLKS